MLTPRFPCFTLLMRHSASCVCCIVWPIYLGQEISNIDSQPGVTAPCCKIWRCRASVCAQIGLLLDTKGPEVRSGDLPTPIELSAGDTFTFTIDLTRPLGPFETHVNYDNFVKDVKVKDILLVDGGMQSMQVWELKRAKCAALSASQLFLLLSICMQLSDAWRYLLHASVCVMSCGQYVEIVVKGNLSPRGARICQY